MFLNILNHLSSMSQKKILAIAGIVALLMCGLFYVTLSSITDSKTISAENESIETNFPVVEVVSAASDIPAQTIIQEKMLKLTKFPENMKPQGALTDISEVVGKISRVDILAEDVINDRKLFKSIDEAGFIGLIPADCRAISIRISDVTGVSGFIRPGDHVDVMMVYESDSTIRSELILQDVLLLAMGKAAVQTDKGIIESASSAIASGMTSAMNSANDTSEKSTSTATLALHSDEVLQIAAAAKKGTLYLILRPLKPKEKYVNETDYAMETQSDSSAYNGIIPDINVAETNSTEKPAPAFQPPASPVVPNPTPNVSAALPIQNEESGIEIIQGDQIVKK